jgi:glucan phosphoethanolaminetransferase (alkaline phosphatase superfamily)
MDWSEFRTDPYRLAASLEDHIIKANYPSRLSFEKKNVVIIMADSLRADHMQIYGYERPTTPFLADLLEKGQLRKVRYAFSTCSDTLCGILSTMASRDYRSLNYNNFKLYDLLKDQGYRVYFVLSDNHTAWYNLRRAYGRSIDYYYDGSSSNQYSYTDDRLLFEGLQRVPSYNGTPAFFFFDLMSPHFAGVKHEVFDRYRPSKLQADYWSFFKGKFDPVVLTNRYDNGVIQADAFIHEIFAVLDRKGYLNGGLIVILADHGDALGEHGNYAHTVSLYQEEIGIPMLIYDQAKVRYANLEFAAQIDVAPTIIDRLGLPIPSCWQGRSLLDENIKCCSYHQTRRNNPSKAVIYRTEGAIYKYLRWGAKAEAPQREELYELLSDPGEQINLMSTADLRLIRHLRERMSEAFDIPLQ